MICGFGFILDRVGYVPYGAIVGPRFAHRARIVVMIYVVVVDRYLTSDDMSISNIVYCAFRLQPS